MKHLLMFVFVVLVCISIEVANPVHARKHGKSNVESILLTSLPPQHGFNCTPSLGGKKNGSKVELKSRFGACSKLKGSKTFNDIFLHDELRLESWILKLSNSSSGNGSEVTAATSLPSHSALSLGDGSYYVTIGLGTPKTHLSLAFDTGSGLTWTQCKPCSVSCFTQVEPIFDPSTSSTYSKVGCESTQCRSFVSNHVCSSSNSCVYNQSYLDNSFTAGFLSKETITLTPTEALSGFYFGCGQQNVGLFNGIAGLLGLDMSNVSIVSQASSVYGKYFSYCLPNFYSNSTGHLTFGKGGTTSTNIKYTPLIIKSNTPDFYFLELQSISVGGSVLNLSPTVFSSPGTIIDSGTTVTRLPPAAYSAVLDAFTDFMDAQNYPSIPSPFTILEGCYNLTGISNALVPSITLSFSGEVQMKIPTLGIVFFTPNDGVEVCLAFASSKTPGLTILGNLQHQTFDVVYDIDAAKIGFGPDGCT